MTTVGVIISVWFVGFLMSKDTAHLTLEQLRTGIKKCFSDTKMPEDDQFEPDVVLFDIEETINRLAALFSSHIEALRDEMEKKKIRYDVAKELRAGTYVRGDDAHVEGHNKAISECQRLLGDLK